MKYLIPSVFLVFIILFSFDVFAKPHQDQNFAFEYNTSRSVRMTGMGVGGWWGVHYERSWLSYGSMHVNTRVGISAYSLKDFENKLNPDVQFPLSIGLVYGKKHQLAIHAGSTAHRVVVYKHETKNNKWEWSPFIAGMYRYYFHPKWFGNVSVNLIKVPSQKMYLWPGISIGRSF